MGDREKLTQPEANSLKKDDLFEVAAKNEVQVAEDATVEDVKAALVDAGVVETDVEREAREKEETERKEAEKAQAKADEEAAEAKKRGDKPEASDANGHPEGTAFFYQRGRIGRVQVKPAPELKGGKPNPDGTLIEFVEWGGFVEKDEGDTIRSGYLATDNERAIEVLRESSGVEEIDRDEYEKKVSKLTRVTR